MKDCLIYKKTLESLNNYGLCIIAVKSVQYTLGVPFVEFLGCKISPEGIQPLPLKVGAIRNFPEPQSHPFEKGQHRPSIYHKLGQITAVSHHNAQRNKKCSKDSIRSHEMPFKQ